MEIGRRIAWNNTTGDTEEFEQTTRAHVLTLFLSKILNNRKGFKAFHPLKKITGWTLPEIKIQYSSTNKPAKGYDLIQHCSSPPCRYVLSYLSVLAHHKLDYLRGRRAARHVCHSSSSIFKLCKTHTQRSRQMISAVYLEQFLMIPTADRTRIYLM